jgi:hypothetical protein
MVGKLGSIKETAADAAEIIGKLSTPEVQESLQKIKDITDNLKLIMDSFVKPEAVRNIENVKSMVASAQEMSSRIGTAINSPEAKGTIEEIKKTSSSARQVLDSIQKMQQDQETIIVMKEMVTSIKELMDEIKVTIKTSTRPPDGIIYNVKQTAEEVKDLYKNQTGHVKDLRKS